MYVSMFRFFFFAGMPFSPLCRLFYFLSIDFSPTGQWLRKQNWKILATAAFDQMRGFVIRKYRKIFENFGYTGIPISHLCRRRGELRVITNVLKVRSLPCHLGLRLLNCLHFGCTLCICASLPMLFLSW